MKTFGQTSKHSFNIRTLTNLYRHWDFLHLQIEQFSFIRTAAIGIYMQAMHTSHTVISVLLSQKAIEQDNNASRHKGPRLSARNVVSLLVNLLRAQTYFL